MSGFEQGDFDGRIGLVTGAASGIGFAACEVYGDRGAELYLLDINRPAGEEAVEKLAANGVKAHFRELDLTNVPQVRSVVQGIAEETEGNIDFAFSNAGISKQGNSFWLEEGNWEKVIGTNLDGRFFLVQSVAQVMKQRNRDKGYPVGGSFVVTSSVIGRDGSPGLAAYGGANGAVYPIVRGLAVEWGNENIRVNGVAPAYVRTPLVLGNLSTAHINWLEEHTPLGRLAEPSEIAEVVAFLTSDKASYVTGHVVEVTGGFSVPSMKVPRFPQAEAVPDPAIQ